MNGTESGPDERDGERANRSEKGECARWRTRRQRTRFAGQVRAFKGRKRRGNRKDRRGAARKEKTREKAPKQRRRRRRREEERRDRRVRRRHLLPELLSSHSRETTPQRRDATILFWAHSVRRERSETACRSYACPNDNETARDLGEKRLREWGEKSAKWESGVAGCQVYYRVLT